MKMTMKPSTMKTATMKRVDAARAHRLSKAAVRLRLKPAHRGCGFVQGAWWPRSTRITVELPSLLGALGPRFGTVDRVVYHRHDWSSNSSNATDQGVELTATETDPNVLTLFGEKFGMLTLLVVPPYTNAVEAYGAMTRAANADNASTPDQLLNHSRRRIRERHLAQAAVQRWESEGGAVFA